jgi:hypothetical protein
MPAQTLLDRLSAATLRAHEALQRAMEAHAAGNASAYRVAMADHDAALQEARRLRREMSEPPTEAAEGGGRTRT